MEPLAPAELADRVRLRGWQPFTGYSSGTVGPDQKWQPGSEGDLIDRAWLDRAELVLLEPEYLGSFTKRLEVAYYRLPRARQGIPSVPPR